MDQSQDYGISSCRAQNHRFVPKGPLSCQHCCSSQDTTLGIIRFIAKMGDTVWPTNVSNSFEQLALYGRLAKIKPLLSKRLHTWVSVWFMVCSHQYTSNHHRHEGLSASCSGDPAMICLRIKLSLILRTHTGGKAESRSDLQTKPEFMWGF